MEQFKKYKVEGYENGLYEFDTLFLSIDKDIIQVPIIKKLYEAKDLIGKYISLEKIEPIINNIKIIK